MRVLILDGYIDEPACLGVPPYVSPQVRYAYGAALDSGAEPGYLRVAEWRRSGKLPDGFDLLFLFGGATVPGKYLRGYPMSKREAGQMAGAFKGSVLMAGPLTPEMERLPANAVAVGGDGDAALRDALNRGEIRERRRTPSERERWSVLGAELLRHIPEGADRCVMEVELFRGCPRFVNGGCSFCSEPLFGMPEMRGVREVVREVGALCGAGGVNVRLGGQSCIFSYHAEGIGRAEVPKPRPDVLEELMKGIRNAAPGLRVLHVDNANPAVMANHKRESEDILRILAQYTTDGNVLAMGLESADPRVKAENNLNATPEETLEAVEMVNRVGREKGPGGMPKLLPGINFVMGLPGESASTYELNMRFLKEVRRRGLWLRRINIRQVIDSGRGLQGRTDHRLFRRFKEWVRKEVDLPMLEEMIPRCTVLRRALVEKVEKGWSSLRQPGSYPLLIKVPYAMEPFAFYDVSVIGWGGRSLTAVEYPFRVNRASLSMLEALPGIGKKRAARLFRARPFDDVGGMLDAMDGFAPDPGWEQLFSFET